MQPNNQDKYVKNILSEAQIFWERHGDPTRRTLEYSWKEKPQQQQHDIVGEDFMCWIKRILFDSNKTKSIIRFIFQQRMHM